MTQVLTEWARCRCSARSGSTEGPASCSNADQSGIGGGIVEGTSLRGVVCAG